MSEIHLPPAGPRADEPDKFVSLTARWLAESGLQRAPQASAGRTTEAAALATLLALTPQFIWEADPQGRITHSSAYGREYMGLTVEQLRGNGWVETVEPDDRDRVAVLWQQALAHGTRYEAEFRIRRARDGAYRWHLVRADAVRDGHGRIERWVGIALDIHAVRTARDQIDQSNARLDALGDATPGFLYMKDLDGRMVWCNRAVLEGVGKPAAEVIGRTDREFLGDGAYTDAIEAHDRQVMQGGASLVLEERLHDPERIFLSTKTPWRDASGRIVGLVGVSLDATAERRAQAALAVRERELAGIADNTPAIITRFDRALRHVFVNRTIERITGRAAVEFLGKTNRELGMPAHLCDRWDAALRAVFDTGARQEVEFDFEGPHGARVFHSVMAPDASVDGRIETVTTVAHDVTQLRRQEAATREREARLAQAQRHLADSEERLRLAIQSSSLGWWDMDARSGHLVWNENARRMFDFPEQGEIALDAPVHRMHPDDRDRVSAAIAAAMAADADGTYHQTYRVVWRDGTVRWIDAVGQVHFEACDRRREARRFSGVLWDVTEQQQMVEALTDSERRFRVLADTMPQIVWATRPDGYHDYFNERWYEYTGMPRPDEPGGEYDPAGTGQGWNWKDYLHPDDQAATFAAWGRSLATGDPYHVEYRFKRRDGAWRWFIGRALALRDDAGRTTRWFGTLTDIHDQKLAAQEREDLIERLSAQQAYLRTVLETVPVGIVTCEAPSGRVVDGNRRAEEIFGHPIHPSAGVEAYGEWVCFHPDGRRVQPHEFPAARVIREGVERAEMEVHYQRGDGTLAWVRLVGSPIRDDRTGAVRGVVVASLDMDAERRALEALRDADRRKDEFLAMLAHELRNPLAPMTNAVRLLEREQDLSGIGRRAVEMIGRQTVHMRRLVEDLLEVSRITRGTIELKPEPIMLGSLVHAAVESAMPACEAKHQILEVVLPKRPVKLVADPVRIAQVLENLIGNAVKYTPDGGQIRVDLVDLDEAVEVRVGDNGIGIAPDKIASVFDLFVQAEPGVGAHQGGLGIGLALVKRLVELHGGCVRAESAGRGQGATFTVRLPRAGP